jgi:GGDEF domain-containing protein
MGLLEKAFAYKRKINSNGKKSIMDRITGPAETESADGSPHFSGPGSDTGPSEDDEMVRLRKEDLLEVDEDGQVREAGKPKFTMSPAAAGSSGTGIFVDYMTLYELSRDILRADSSEELFDVMLFSIMGQVGVSSSSILIPRYGDGDQWGIIESRGVHIKKDEIVFRSSAGILGQLINRKEIIDIEEFRDNDSYIDDYYKYIAIDARLLVPFIYDSSVMGVIILGNKLSSDDFTGDEKNFLAAIAEFSAYSYHNISVKNEGIAVHEKPNRFNFEAMQKKIMPNARGVQAREIIQRTIEDLGVASYAIFVKDETDRNYVVFECEKGDGLQLVSQRFRIPCGAALVSEVAGNRGRLSYDDFQNSNSVSEVFSDKQMNRMSMLVVYPYMIDDELIGFTMIFGMEDRSRDIPGDAVSRFCDYIFPYIYMLQDVSYRRGKYDNSIERIFKRIDDEIKRAQELKIPLAMIMLAIKNHKRYHSAFGPEKIDEMSRHIEKFILSRLSDRDFSVRYDRHKILIVLAGKDKKFAVPLANAICNEMVRTFSTQDVQLLITFLTAEFPLDGGDTYTLIDAVN